MSTQTRSPGAVKPAAAQSAMVVGRLARQRGLDWRETRNAFGARLREDGRWTERQVGTLLDAFSAGYGPVRR